MSTRFRSLAVGLGLVSAASLVLAGAAVSKPSAAPNLIKNGGFEQPLVGAGGYTLVNAGQSWGGWKVVGAAGNVAPISTTFQQNGISFVAKAGKQWLDLTGGTSNQKIGVAQTIKTTRGASYRLELRGRQRRRPRRPVRASARPSTCSSTATRCSPRPTRKAARFRPGRPSP